MGQANRLPYGEDANQFVEFRIPSGAAGGILVVNIHGGFWRSRYNLEHAANFCDALTRAGFHTASIEYRRVGQPGGGWPGTLDDVQAAVRTARRQLALPTFVTGHSAGGQLALWLAAQMPDLAGVIALAPVASLRLGWERNLGNGAVRDFMGGDPDSNPEGYAAADPVLHPSAVPRTLIHGDADDIVPVELSRAYVDARKGDVNPPRIVEMPGADHFAVIDPSSNCWPKLLEALLRTKYQSRT